MREVPIRSLLLLDTNADERRLISAIASRAGWSVVGAPDDESAATLIAGPHGRDVRAVLIGSWDSDRSPSIINALRAKREKLPVIVVSHGDSVSIAVDAMRAGASDSWSARCSRAAYRGPCREFRSPETCGRACASLGKTGAATRPRAARRRRAGIPSRACRRCQRRAQSAANPDHRRAGHGQGNNRPRHSRRQPAG